MTAPHLEVGADGEAEAVEYLLARGWEIVARNVRYDDVGELDIIAAKDDVLAFVEVKTRSIADEFDPTVAMNHHKMRKFVNAARAWLKDNEATLGPRWPRLDVITVVGSQVCDHLEDAFEAAGG